MTQKLRSLKGMMRNPLGGIVVATWGARPLQVSVARFLWPRNFRWPDYGTPTGERVFHGFFEFSERPLPRARPLMSQSCRAELPVKRESLKLLGNQLHHDAT